MLSHATAAAVAVRRKFGVYAAAVAVNAVFAILLHVPKQVRTCYLMLLLLLSL